MDILEKILKDAEGDGEEKEPEAPKQEEEEETPKKVEASLDIDKLADAFANRLVSKIKETKSLSEKDTTDLKDKYFSARNGMQGFSYPEPGELKHLGREDKMVLWFKSLMEKDRSLEADRVFKALVEGTDSQGGYLVPEEWRAEVFRVLPDFAVMRRLARVFPMSTDTLNLTSLVARPYAYWVAEYNEKSTTSAEFGQIVLKPNDLVCLLPVTHQLIADANIDIIRFITELFAEAIGIAEDKAFFTGSGTTQPVGLRSLSGVGTYAADGSGAWDDLVTAFYRLPQSVRRSNRLAWVCNRHTLESLHKLKDSDGRPLLLNAGAHDVAQKPTETLLGASIYEQNDLPNKEIWVGDFSAYAIGDRQQITVETTREGGTAWRRNATEIKMVERVDGEGILGKAFMQITNF